MSMLTGLRKYCHFSLYGRGGRGVVGALKGLPGKDLIAYCVLIALRDPQLASGAEVPGSYSEALLASWYEEMLLGLQ